MKNKILILFGFIFLCMLASCTDKDDTFISKSEMEDILYDYHLADAMAQQADGGYNKNVLAYRTAVLKKYNVSQEKFDTSMVYYMRRTDELHTMYQHIADRMQQEATRLGANASGGISAAGDSANVWNGEKTMVLLPNQPYNLYSYDLKTDTTFHKGDRLILGFKTDFIFQDGMRDGIAVLSVVLNNDSVVSRNTHLSSSMQSSLQIDDNDSIGIKEIKGFFMLAKNNSMNASSTTLQLMSIHNIQLIRVHPHKSNNTQAPPQPVQSRIPINKAAPDSERMKPQVMR